MHFLKGNDFGYSDRYPLVRIGSFLKRNRTEVVIEDDVEYKQVTVRTNNGGVCLRGVKKGKDIGTKKQMVVHTGQYIVSKIDARNGAFGIIPEELDGAIVTNDFPVFDVDNAVVNTEFLLLITTTKQFVAFAQSCSSGTTNRRRIDIDKFLEQKIPMPSLDEQERLLSAYNQCFNKSESILSSIDALQSAWEHHVRELLFVKHEVEEEKTGNTFLRLVHYKDITEWGIAMIRKRKGHGYSSLYDIAKIKELCKVNSGGTPSRSNKAYYKGNIPWVKTGEVLNDIIYETEEHISEEAIANSSAKLYPKGSLIIAMYGQGDTRGRSAKLGIDATTNQACAVLHQIDNDKVLTDYLWAYIQVMYDDLRSLASGTNQPNLNADKIKNYGVPLPPREIQEEIVTYTKEKRQQMSILRAEAQRLRQQTLEEFEKELFK